MFLNLLMVILRSKLALWGAISFLLLFPVFFVSILIDLQGNTENPYFSLLLYLIFIPLILIAVILMLSGLLMAKRSGKRGGYFYDTLKDVLCDAIKFNKLRKTVYLFTFLLSFSLVMLGTILSKAYHYTESVSFCGMFCHRIMGPELISYNGSPHSRVKCTACHIASTSNEGPSHKLIGLRQLMITIGGNYPRPIPTPLKSLRPDREICEKCHRPENFHGHKLYFKNLFLSDKENTQVQTVMIMKIGHVGYGGHFAKGVHWHISPEHSVYYNTSLDGKRIVRVSLNDEDGHRQEFVERGQYPADMGPDRLMDCMDCHNRPTHIFPSPEEAIDKKIRDKQIPAALPYVKQQALKAITGRFTTQEEAFEQIDLNLSQWYKDNYPDIWKDRHSLIEKAISGAQQAYAENVFPEMGIQWGTYPDFIGHIGCFRCHNDSFTDAYGNTISGACDLCHIILTQNSPVEKQLVY